MHLCISCAYARSNHAQASPRDTSETPNQVCLASLFCVSENEIQDDEERYEESIQALCPWLLLLKNDAPCLNRALRLSFMLVDRCP